MKKLVGVILVLALLVGVYVVVTWAAAPEETPVVPSGVSAGGPSGAPSGVSAGDSSGIPAGATPAVVEYVHDGDTLFLEDGRKVRLLGINTPEIGTNRECYGDEATDLLRSLLPEGTHVWVEHDIEPLDQYGRSLLFVYTFFVGTDAAINVNLELLREGAAEVEMYKPNVLLRDEAHAAEDAARSAGLGLWGACR